MIRLFIILNILSFLLPTAVLAADPPTVLGYSRTPSGDSNYPDGTSFDFTYEFSDVDSSLYSWQLFYDDSNASDWPITGCDSNGVGPLSSSFAGGLTTSGWNVGETYAIRAVFYTDDNCIIQDSSIDMEYDGGTPLFTIDHAPATAPSPINVSWDTLILLTWTLGYVFVVYLLIHTYRTLIGSKW